MLLKMDYWGSLAYDDRRKTISQRICLAVQTYALHIHIDITQFILNKQYHIKAEQIIVTAKRATGAAFQEVAIKRAVAAMQANLTTGRKLIGALFDDPEIAWDGPLLVLVNRLSASASEIFAGGRFIKCRIIQA